MIYVLGGKLNASVIAAKKLKEIGIKDLYIYPSSGEEKIKEMNSLREYATKENLTIINDLSSLLGKKIFFISIEFDRLIKRGEFHQDSKFINFHFSSLPRYRGTMTSFWPILFREKDTGVTVHDIDDGIDTGDIIIQKKFNIKEDYTCRDLYFKYHKVASEIIENDLEKIIKGDIARYKQDNNCATSFPRFLYKYVPKEFDSRELMLMDRVDVYNLIRSLIFKEFQLPAIDGKRISKISKKPFKTFNMTIRTSSEDLYAEQVSQ
jgi:methionyl-tRNA formyltransferase